MAKEKSRPASSHGHLLEQLLKKAAEVATLVKINESGEAVVSREDTARILAAGGDIMHKIVVEKAKAILEEFEDEDDDTLDGDFDGDMDDLDALGIDGLHGRAASDDIEDADDEIEDEELSDTDLDADDDMLADGNEGSDMLSQEDIDKIRAAIAADGGSDDDDFGSDDEESDESEDEDGSDEDEADDEFGSDESDDESDDEPDDEDGSDEDEDDGLQADADDIPDEDEEDDFSDLK